MRNVFSDIRKLKEFIDSQPALPKILSKALHSMKEKGNDTRGKHGYM